MIVTYSANLMTRRLGYSLVPDEDPASSQMRLADILNINERIFQSLAEAVEERVRMVRRSLIASWEQRHGMGPPHDKHPDGDTGPGEAKA